MISLSRVNEKNICSSPVIRVAVSVFFLLLCSKVRAPLFYVPITLQTLAIYLIGLRLCPKEAFASVMGYLALGCFGAPVWAHSGMALFGTTTGYLLGMLLAAPLISWMVRKSVNQIISCIAGILLIDTLGVSWLLNFMDLHSAIICGFLPFIIPDIFKIYLAVGTNLFLISKKNI